MNEPRNEDERLPAGAHLEGSPPARSERKPYQSPALIEYGSVAKLTQGTLSMNADFFGGGFRRMSMCL